MCCNCAVAGTCPFTADSAGFPPPAVSITSAYGIKVMFASSVEEEHYR